MNIVQWIVMAIAVLSGVVLVVAVTMQTSKADGFSAAMGGGGESGRFRKGSREEMLDRVTKFAAIVWICTCAVNALLWYRMHQ